jgi:hypothetical protein
MTRILLTTYYALVFIVSFVLFTAALYYQPATKLPTREPIHRRW